MSVIVGDCREIMAAMDTESVDAVVTDPPYGLEFMGKSWDRLDWRDGGSMTKPGIGDRNIPWPSFGGETANPTCAICGGRARGAKKCACDEPDWRVRGERMDAAGQRMRRQQSIQEWHETWAREAYRVLKPGGRLLAFGGSRTHHRMVCAIEDAGFVIEDEIIWLYGSGFPKHKSKLKPAHEPICVAWKPDTRATALNVDACRIKTSDDTARLVRRETGAFGSEYQRVQGYRPDYHQDDYVRMNGGSTLGRWPANVVLSHTPECVEVGTKRVKGGNDPRRKDGTRSQRCSEGWDRPWKRGEQRQEAHAGYADPDGTELVAAWDCADGCPVALLDAQSGERASGAWNGHRNTPKTQDIYGAFASGDERGKPASTGGASRFFLNVPPDDEATRMFYCAKASRAEREMGLQGSPQTPVHRYGEQGQGPLPQQTPRVARPQGNHHPTVKPLALMRWLVRLVTPPGPDSVVLDPFAGSGTTGCAAAMLGFEFVGIEADPEYAEIAERRIAHWRRQGRETDDLAPRQLAMVAD
jgi:DNA modification methylase